MRAIGLAVCRIYLFWPVICTFEGSLCVTTTDFHEDDMATSINKPVMICGFHRSGTSMTGQIMHNAGLLLDRNPLTAHPSNPDSHFESDIAVKLHNDIFKDNHTDWLLCNYDITNNTFEVSSANRARAEALVAKYEHAEPWGFKDPRSSLFLDLWSDVLQRPRVIMVYRHFGQCQNSLLKRASESLVNQPQVDTDSARLWQNSHLSISAWVHYNNQLIKYAQANPKDCVVVSQEALVNGFDLVTEVNTRFNLMLDSNVNSGVNKLKVRSAGSKYLAPDCAVLQSQAEAVWEKLNELSCAPAIEIPTPTVLSSAGAKKNVYDFDKFIAPTQQGSGKLVAEPHGLQRISIEDLATPVILNKKVNYLLNSGGAENVVSIFTDFKALAPENSQIELNLGHAYMRLSQYSMARKHYLRAQAIRPEHPNILNLLARVELACENYTAAIGQYELAIKAQPTNANFRAFYCAALLASNQPQKALTECRLGRVETQPNHWLEIKFIELLILQGLVAEAEECCRAARNNWPAMRRFNVLHFQTLTLQGKAGEAQKAFDCGTREVICNTPDHIDHLQKVLDTVVNRSWCNALCESVYSELERIFDAADQVSSKVPCAS